MKTLIIIVFSLFVFSFSYGQNGLDKGPFYKNAKVWKAEKKSTDVYVISNKEDIKNGLYVLLKDSTIKLKLKDNRFGV